MTEQLGTCIAKMWTQVFQMKVENKSVIFFLQFSYKKNKFLELFSSISTVHLR